MSSVCASMLLSVCSFGKVGLIVQRLKGWWFANRVRSEEGFTSFQLPGDSLEQEDVMGFNINGMHDRRQARGVELFSRQLRRRVNDELESTCLRRSLAYNVLPTTGTLEEYIPAPRESHSIYTHISKPSP